MARRTGTAAVASELHGRGPGVVSKEAKSAAYTLLDAAPDVRLQILRGLAARDLKHVLLEGRREMGTAYCFWDQSPYAFVQDVLGETMWDLQRQIMDSVAIPGVKRLAVPAGFGVGKTTLAGRMVAWAGAVNAIGTMKIVTTATRMRQVRSQLWPHIKTAVAKGGLPGRTDTVQWIAEDMYGNDVQIAYGFSAGPYDEAAVQGVHGTPKLLIVVDEAGGIAPLIGKGTNNLLTGDAKLLAIGNPAMNDPGSWFETLVDRGENPDDPSTVSIRISTLDSPALTGEKTPICRLCVPNLDGHTISEGVGGLSHMPDRDWLHTTFEDYAVPVARGTPLKQIIALADDPDADLPAYIVAKVFARFPRDAGNKIIPASWVQGALDVDEPAELVTVPLLEGQTVELEKGPAPDYVRLCDLGLEGENDTHMVKRGAWVRLGVDVAADGGDEFAIARVVGDMAEIRHHSSGKSNADSMVVSERILAEIDQAQRLADALGTRARVRVKVDTIGVGWGVVGNLQRWAATGRHRADIVPVNVAEKIERDDESATMRPMNKRAEMWLAGRSLLQPDPSTGYGRLRLRVDKRTAAQLSVPNLLTTSAGLVQVEGKASIRKRGGHSPDRGESLLLAVYEPVGLHTKRRGLIA